MTAIEQRESRRAKFFGTLDLSQEQIDSLRAWLVMVPTSCGDCDDRHPWPCAIFVN